jgi:hypothetical protein
VERIKYHIDGDNIQGILINKALALHKNPKSTHKLQEDKIKGEI